MRTIPPPPPGQLDETARLDVLDRVNELLELRYRSGSLGNVEDPLAEAVYIILSRQTRESAYQRVYRDLRREWPTWEALLDAPIDDLVEVLRPAGFGPTRARQVKDLLSAVAKECRKRGLDGAISLDWLHKMPDPEVEDFLLSLPGIGPKSARCIMHYSLERDALAVDTHVRRVLDRLGLVKDPGGKVKHASYEDAVPAPYRRSLHVNLIHHGRAFCRSTSPRCAECPLISFCRTGRDRQVDTQGSPVAVELFAGGGGLGEGFTRAGFKVAAAVEWDRDAAQTYRLNHPGTIVVEADATELKPDELLALAPLARHASTVIAGPPCQGYSVAGRRKADDEKNELYRVVIAYAKALDTRFLVIENVPGMRKVEGRKFVDAVADEIEGAGYSVEPYTLRACDYGVPQLRRRVIFMAQRSDAGVAPTRPPTSHCAGSFCEMGCGDDPGSRCGRPATPTVLQCLSDLPRFDAGQDAEYYRIADGRILLNASTMQHSERVLAKISGIRPGTGPISYRRVHADVARTIVAGHRALPVHPVLDRTISVREAARIQGFYDDHCFAGFRSRQPLQVANAVPPPLAEAVGKGILAAARM